MMRWFATVFVLLAMMFMANVVCAGVMLVLTDITMGYRVADHYLVWLTLGVISIGAALAFLYGAIPAGIRFLHWIE